MVLFRYSAPELRYIKIAEIDTDDFSEAINLTVTKCDCHWANPNPKFLWLDNRCYLTDDETFELDYFRSTHKGDLLVKDNRTYVVQDNNEVTLLSETSV